MKLISVTTLRSAALVSGLFLMAPVMAAKMDPDLERDLVRVCKAIQDDDRSALQQAVKRSRLNYRQLAEGLVCNGQDMYTFAATSNSLDAQALIASKVYFNDGELTAQR